PQQPFCHACEVYVSANSVINGTALNDFIRAYEAARAEGKDASLDLILPPPEHPLYAEVHRELQAREQEYLAGRAVEPERMFERTVWNNGKIGMPQKSERQESAGSLSDRNLKSKTAPIDVHVFSREEL